jgi:hypothetical protein
VLCPRSLLVLDKQRQHLLLGAAVRLSQDQLPAVQLAERASRRAGSELPVKPLALEPAPARPVLRLVRARLAQVP